MRVTTTIDHGQIGGDEGDRLTFPSRLAEYGGKRPLNFMCTVT